MPNRCVCWKRLAIGGYGGALDSRKAFAREFQRYVCVPQIRSINDPNTVPKLRPACRWWSRWWARSAA